MCKCPNFMILLKEKKEVNVDSGHVFIPSVVRTLNTNKIFQLRLSKIFYEHHEGSLTHLP